MTTKLSEQLHEQLEHPDVTGMLEVIIELHDRDEPAASETQSRQEKIAAWKEGFDREVVPVEEAVKSVGGELTGRAWINRTVRARVPADRLEKLAAQHQIAKIDIPHKIEPDVLHNSHQ
jgi:hypothetical protein